MIICLISYLLCMLHTINFHTFSLLILTLFIMFCQTLYSISLFLCIWINPCSISYTRIHCNQLFTPISFLILHYIISPIPSISRYMCPKCFLPYSLPTPTIPHMLAVYSNISGTYVDASSLIKQILQADLKLRADIEVISHHWWTNLGYNCTPAQQYNNKVGRVVLPSMPALDEVSFGL